MTRTAIFLAGLVAGMLPLACESERTPAAPSPVSANFVGEKSALVCIENRESYVSVENRESYVSVDRGTLCTEDMSQHRSTGCDLEYNARLENTCSDGWPIPPAGATAALAIRVNMRVVALRGGQSFDRHEDSWDIPIGRHVWLCGGNGPLAAEDCRFEVTPEVIQRLPAGDFEVKRRWNACWLEHRPAAGGLGCYPDPGFPEFPSAEGGAVSDGF